MTAINKETYQDLEQVYSNKTEALFDWVFHYNHHTDVWTAIPRDYYVHYWNGRSEERMVRSRSIQTLVDLITRTQGDRNKIEQLVREQ